MFHFLWHRKLNASCAIGHDSFTRLYFNASFKLARRSHSFSQYQTACIPIAIVPHDGNGDASCLILAEAVAAARKLKGRIEVEAGKAVVSNGTTRIEFAVPEKMEHPAGENYMGGKSEQFIEVNADLLATLAAALYQKSTGKYGATRAVRIYFPADSGKPIRVETSNAVGTIMPCKLRG